MLKMDPMTLRPMRKPLTWKKKKARRGESQSVPDVRFASETVERWGSHHALRVPQCPSIVEEGIKDQWVGIEGYHQVSKGQTHHEHVTWRRGARTSIKYICSRIYRGRSDCETSHIWLWHTLITSFIQRQSHTSIHAWHFETLLICFSVLRIHSTLMGHSQRGRCYISSARTHIPVYTLSKVDITLKSTAILLSAIIYLKKQKKKRLLLHAVWFDDFFYHRITWCKVNQSFPTEVPWGWRSFFFFFEWRYTERSETKNTDALNTTAISNL